MREETDVVITSRFFSQVKGEMDIIHIVQTRTILGREDKEFNGHMRHLAHSCDDVQ